MALSTPQYHHISHEQSCDLYFSWNLHQKRFQNQGKLNDEIEFNGEKFGRIVVRTGEDIS